MKIYKTERDRKAVETRMRNGSYKWTEERKKEWSNNHPKYWLGKKRGSPSKKTIEKLRESNKGKNNGEQICVHHINGNHNDNRPENRIIMTREEHTKLHNLQGDVGWNKYWRKQNDKNI